MTTKKFIDRPFATVLLALVLIFTGVLLDVAIMQHKMNNVNHCVMSSGEFTDAVCDSCYHEEFGPEDMGCGICDTTNYENYE